VHDDADETVVCLERYFDLAEIVVRIGVLESNLTRLSTTVRNRRPSSCVRPEPAPNAGRRARTSDRALSSLKTLTVTLDTA
jgi:hypothetical protein